jgi:hypothetical protein
VPAAEAKKLGLIKTTKVEPTANGSGSKDDKDADKKPAGDAAKDKKPIGKDAPVADTSKKAPINKENQDTENKKIGGGIVKPTTKPSSTKIGGGINKKGAEDADDDPIAKSLNEREKAGGVT